MRRTNSMKGFFTLLSLFAIPLILTSGGGGGSGSLTPNGPVPGGSPPNQKEDIKCSDLKFETYSHTFHKVALKYDINSLREEPAFLNSLNEHHQGAFNGYSIGRLSTIINSQSLSHKDTMYRASLTINYTSAECTGVVKYKAKDHSMVSMNVLYKVPSFGVYLKKSILEIATIQCPITGYQLIWTKTLDSSAQITEIEASCFQKPNTRSAWWQHDADNQKSAPYVVKDGATYYRFFDGKFTVVDNTVPLNDKITKPAEDTYLKEKYIPSITGRDIIVGGSVSTSASYNSPLATVSIKN